ncbi:MAG: GNAT family N-acetyltransferase [Proteobacteria bacterium]|nr:GNAT family N-acetyltransferase [Pseudomonadota bacterium]
MSAGGTFTVLRARAGDAAGIARVHVAAWRSAYAGILPDTYLTKLSERAVMGQWAYLLRAQGAFSVFVAKERRGNVVGYGSCDLARRNPLGYEGEIQTLYVHDDFRQIGLGRALMAEMARHLRARDCASLLVWVLRDNPSRWFYAALGGKPVAEETISVAGSKLPQVAYGWPDISALLEKSASPRDL